MRLLIEFGADAQLASIVEGALAFAPLANFPFEVTPQMLREAMIAADTLGADVSDTSGDAAYRRLQAS